MRPPRQYPGALPDELRAQLVQIARMPKSPVGVVPRLAQRFGKNPNSLLQTVYLLRQVTVPPGTAWQDHYRVAMLANHAYARQKRAPQTTQQDGAEGGTAACGPAPVPRVAPSAAAPGSVRVSSLPDLALAVCDPRPVAPAAGTVHRMVPAGSSVAEDSPGLRWARQVLARGMPLDKVLRSAGDRLSWAEREALRRPGVAA